MIKFALCDDNDQLLIKLKDMLENIFIKHDFDGKVTFVSRNINELLNYINQNEIDVLFLDIDLNSELNGLEFAKEIRKINKSLYLIFVTGHFEYIISAYECKTFDFIQKPFSIKRLESTVVRLFEDANFNTAKFIKINNSNKLINQDLIDFIQKDHVKIIYKTNTHSVECYGSFNKIEKDLPANFIRCHKSYIVNINNISNIDYKTNTLFFKGSTNNKCYIGPKYKNKFMEVLNNYEFTKESMAMSYYA